MNGRTVRTSTRSSISRHSPTPTPGSARADSSASRCQNKQGETSSQSFGGLREASGDRSRKENGREVVYDAEHFFDGYDANPEYAMETLKAAYRAGPDVISLCDTKAASLPYHISSITKLVLKEVVCAIGIN